ncbi:MAG: Hsp33 family molecular chaperone HslO [Pseudomonadota bacterium]
MTPSNLSQDDYVAGFASASLPISGRIVKLGRESLSPILNRHAYPDHLAEILGEALMISVLVGASMQFEGRVIAQAEGDGPVSMMVGEYRKDGGLRAYAQHEAERWAWLEKVNKGDKPHVPQLFGAMGRLGLIVINDQPNAQPYQGIVPMDAGSLPECAQNYFERSVQVPTALRIKVRRDADGHWTGGGLMIQRIAGDDARGDTEDGWREAEALFATLKDEELIDPSLPGDQLLYRLFHEGGVTMDPIELLSDACTCNRERLIGTLQAMSDESLREMVEPDGTLGVDCQFCSRHYTIAIEEVTNATS